MLDINTVALIVLLNDPQAQMSSLAERPPAWGRWRSVAMVALLIAVGLLALS